MFAAFKRATTLDYPSWPLPPRIILRPSTPPRLRQNNSRDQTKLNPRLDVHMEEVKRRCRTVLQI